MKVTNAHKAAAREILTILAKQPSVVQEDLAFGASFSVELAGLVHIGFVTSISEEAGGYLSVSQFQDEADRCFKTAVTPDGELTGKRRFSHPYVYIPMDIVV